MANWTPKPQPFGANRAPTLVGTSSVDGVTPVPVAVNPATGALATSGSGGSGGGTSSTYGATFPTTGTAVGASDGTNMQPLLVDGSGYLEVDLKVNPLVTAPLVGQSKIATTGTAVQLNGGTSQALTNGIIITAATGNAAVISIGGSGVNNTTGGTGNGYLLAAGASISFAITNTNDIYINGTAADYVSWAGS